MARPNKAVRDAYEKINDAQRDRIWRMANGYEFGPGRPSMVPVKLGLVDEDWTRLTPLGKAVAKLCPAVV